MVEVVRDTVGRHDTFNLACTAKYYEDMGYMGILIVQIILIKVLKNMILIPEKVGQL